MGGEGRRIPIAIGTEDVSIEREARSTKHGVES